MIRAVDVAISLHVIKIDDSEGDPDDVLYSPGWLSALCQIVVMIAGNKSATNSPQIA